MIKYIFKQNHNNNFYVLNYKINVFLKQNDLSKKIIKNLKFCEVSKCQF